MVPVGYVLQNSVIAYGRRVSREVVLYSYSAHEVFFFNVYICETVSHTALMTERG